MTFGGDRVWKECFQLISRYFYAATYRRTYNTIVLPPSRNECPKPLLSRENSGISPKRHMIRIIPNELYTLMYNMK